MFTILGRIYDRNASRVERPSNGIGKTKTDERSSMGEAPKYSQPTQNDSSTSIPDLAYHTRSTGITKATSENSANLDTRPVVEQVNEAEASTQSQHARRGGVLGGGGIVGGRLEGGGIISGRRENGGIVGRARDRHEHRIGTVTSLVSKLGSGVARK